MRKIKQETAGKISILFSALLLLVTFGVGIASAENWPMFRANPNRTGNIAETTAGTTAISGRITWQRQVDDGIQSSPALFEDKVYFGSNDGNLYALRTSDGEILWKYSVNNWISSSPAIGNGLVVFGSYDSRVYALDARTGKLKWRFTTHNDVASSPAIADGRVYFGGIDGYIYCVDLKTGWQKWRYKAGREVYG